MKQRQTFQMNLINLCLLCKVDLIILNAIFSVVRGNNTDEGGLIVDTAYGKVKGTFSGHARVFYGVPYAAPPIGSLR